MRNFITFALFTLLSRNEYLRKKNFLTLFLSIYIHYTYISMLCIWIGLKHLCIRDIQDSTRSSSASNGSCRAAKKCCDGKDTDCEVKLDPSETNIILNFSGESCYCDHGCLDMGDCCHDFKDYCGGTGHKLIVSPFTIL